MIENTEKKIIALGYFDCVHIAHRRILQKARDMAEASGVKSAAITFSDNVKSSYIYNLQERKRLLSELVDEIVTFDFTDSIKNMSPIDFLDMLVEKYGAENYIVDVGGEVRCRGLNRQGRAWRIGVETPFDGNMSDGEYLQKRIQMTGGGLATSGNYRRFYLDGEGNKVAHTIDPRTGCSAVSRLLSVTVAAPTCAEADALGTMFLAMGADDALAAVERMPGVKAYFILAGDGGEYEEYVSPAMEALILK